MQGIQPVTSLTLESSVLDEADASMLRYLSKASRAGIRRHTAPSRASGSLLMLEEQFEWFRAGEYESESVSTRGRRMTLDAKVMVVGSLNLDLVVRVPRLPMPGETVLGEDVERHLGGKGANQATAAARLGRSTGIVGCVGEDDAGRELRDGLIRNGVEVEHLRLLPGVPSGTALIAVSPEGENQIVVSPGANAQLASEHVFKAAEDLQAAAVVLIQLEVPLEAVEAAAVAAGGTVVLNPAPARRLPSALLERVDVLVPNRVELAALVGAASVASTLEEVTEQARQLPYQGHVVVTLGPEGVLLVDGPRRFHLPAPPVKAVDATSAGDAFCGALADALAAGGNLESAARWGVAAAAVAVTRHGAQNSLPTREEVPTIP